MSDLYYPDGTKLELLQKGNAFETYLASLKTSAFPHAIGKHTFGKSYIAFGDSLLQYSGGNGVSGTGFLTQINKYLGMNITQMGYAGSAWTGTGTGAAYNRIKTLIEEGVHYDVITLAWGTNGDTDNGTIDDVAASDGTMVAVMKWAIDSIRQNFPMSGLGIIIPPGGASAMAGDTKANLMIEVCKLMRVPYLDLYYGANIRLSNSIYDGLGSDQVHLDWYGRNRYASALGQFIERICPYHVTYTIKRNFTNVEDTSKYTYNYWTDGESFSCTLAATSGTISSATVTMGGTDITATAWDADTSTVSIGVVRGNIVITAAAE